MRLKCAAFAALAVTVTVANGSLNFGLDRFKSLPSCNSGISKQQKEGEFVIEEEKNCRWRVPKELIRGRNKIKLFEIKTDCVESEDQLFMLDGQEILGPFCHDFEYSSNYKYRHRRDSAAHEVDVSLLNAAEGTEIIYIAAPGGFKFRFKFNFEWELISAPSQFNSSQFVPEDCGPQHFAPSFLSAFSDKLADTESPEDAFRGMKEFSASMAGFSSYFESHFSEFCSILATRVPCQFFQSSEFSAQEIFAKLRALVRFIISNCDDGFGHNWEAKLDQLEIQVGGEIPELDFPISTIRPSLCGVCESDLDCGSFGEFFMTCSEETNRCVCADQWTDSNGNPHDGCESFEGEARKDVFQCRCQTSNTSAQPQRTTTSSSSATTTTTTSTRTTTPMTTTYEPSESTARTEISVENQVHEVIEVSSKCPSNWLVSPIRADASPWRSSLHAPREEMCLFAHLPACSEPLFEAALENSSQQCHNARAIELFKSVVRKVAQVSVSGDGDRTCLFSIHDAPCRLLDFKATSNARNFVYQLAHVVKSWAIDKCGKNHLSSLLMPKIIELVTIVDAAAENNCPKLPIISALNEEEFDNMDFSTAPETTAELELINHATPKPIVDRFTTLRDGLCAAKSFGRLAPVVFKARAFAIRDPEIAFARFKTFADEVGKLGKKTAALERKRRAGTCDNSIAGKMPCHLLDFATTEKACQLAQRAEALFGFVKERCDAEWNRFFGNVVDELVEASANSDGSACSTDEKALLSETRKLSKQIEKENGFHFKEEFAAAKANLKIERQEAKKSRLSRKEAKNKAQIEKIRKLAAKKLEAAMLEVDKKQEKLEALKIAVAAAEAGNYALLERRKNNDRNEEKNEEMLLDVFYDFESEEENEEERNFECALPQNLDFEAAEQKFERITDPGSSKLFYFGIINRLKRRFRDALEYINESAANCAEKGVFVSCSDLDSIFNSADFGEISVKTTIKAAANLVSVLERECAEFSFPEFYLSIRGKTAKINL